jgi:hypothetical protein
MSSQGENRLAALGAVEEISLNHRPTGVVNHRWKRLDWLNWLESLLHFALPGGAGQQEILF